MKYNIILTISLAAAVLVSCAKQEIDGSGQEQAGTRISGTIMNTPDTKTFMGESDVDGSGKEFYPVYWSEGDRIALFSKKDAGIFTLNEIQTDRTKADFTGPAGKMPIKFEGSDVFPAAYPADNAFATCDGDTLFVGSYLPYTQRYKSGTFDDDVFPMAAASKNGEDFEFWNLCGVIQIPVVGKVDGLKIRSITLTGNDGEVIAGGIGMKFDARTGDPITDGVTDGDENFGKKIGKYGSEGYTRITVKFDEPVVLSSSSATYVNIAVIPQRFNHGISVEIEDATNMGRTTSKIATAFTVKRSVLTRLTPNFEYDEAEPLQIANSYVYSDAGYYIMPAYAMGNRMDVKLPTEGRRIGADLLWSELITVNHNTTNRDDLKPAVTNIEYISDEDGFGMLQFKINIDPDTGEPYRGNAAIALYDEDTKEVIWSWHVWMSETVHDVVTGGSCSSGTYSYDLPDGTHVDYSAESSSGKLVVMDRNLGAISADPADGWKTYGLYYQNGRRDPFIGGHWDGTTAGGGSNTYSHDGLDVRDDESTAFNVGDTDTAPVWYNEELAPKGWFYQKGFQDISTALRYPMTLSTGDETVGNGQWTDYRQTDNKEWMDPNASADNKKKGSTSTGGIHGNTGLSDGGHQSYWNRTKTIMDPCPIGYSVLGENGGLYLGSDSKEYIFEDRNVTGSSGITHPDHAVYGMRTQIAGYDPVWWPAAGVRTIQGKLGDVGYRGMYYHYDHISNSHGGHGSAFNYNGAWKTGVTTNHAASVRCVREKQFSNLEKYPLK